MVRHVGMEIAVIKEKRNSLISRNRRLATLCSATWGTPGLVRRQKEEKEEHDPKPLLGFSREGMGEAELGMLRKFRIG